MPAVKAPLLIEAGSYEPVYWLVTNPDTGAPLDLTASGFSVALTVNSSQDGAGVVLLELADDSFRRTATGRIYFEPTSVESSAWPFNSGYYQAEISHPSGETVRFGQGPFTVDPELVLT